MADDPDILNTTRDSETEKSRALTLDSLSDEQLAMLATSWAGVSDSKTPMADLRGAMTDSGLFEFLPKYETNNLELRELATHAQGELEDRHEHHHKKELQAIIDATKTAATYADKRAALSDLLGFRRIYDMDNLEIDRFIADAQQKLAAIESADAPADDVGTPSKTTNRELADQVGDLLDGQLIVDGNDHVRYGAGASAYSPKADAVQQVGGRFEHESQLRDIVAFQDQIREGLAHRDEPGQERDVTADDAETTDDELTGDDIDQDAYTQRHEAHTHEDEAPAEGDYVDRDDEREETPSFSAAFLDTSKSAHARALEAAEAKRRDELQKGSRIRRFLRNLWKGENAVAGAYIFERYKKQMLDKIIDTQDTLVHETDDIDARAAAELALIERFKSEYDDEEMLHATAGEKRRELGNDSEFGRGLKELVQRFVSGEIADPAALEEEKKRLVAELRERGDPDLLGEGLVGADDFLKLAQNVKAAVEHGHSLERVLESMKLYTGVAADGVRSEAHLSRVDKVVERLRQSKITAVVSPTTISMAAAIGLGVARAGRGSLVKALGVTVAPGVLGGGFAALRENQRVKVERALHAREMAQGKQYTPGDKRREQMETARYNSVSASEVTAELEGLFVDGEEPTAEEIQAAYESIAAVDTRIRLSDRRKIDYISFSDPTTVESERLALNVARAKAKRSLARHLDKLPQEFRDSLQISEGMSVNDALERYTSTLDTLNEDATEKDAAFAKLKRARVARAATVGFETSFVMGVATQEALAAALPSYDGLAEHLLKPEHISTNGHQTLLEGVFHGQAGSTHTEHILPADTYKSYTIAGHKDVIELPTNYNLTTDADGSVTITGPDGATVVEHFPVGANGTVDPAQIKAGLEAHGISVSDQSTTVDVSKTETHNLTVQEYNAQHKTSLTKITRDYWDDNNTAKFDKNELKLWWGGEGNTGAGANGSVLMDVSHMTKGGSYHGLEHTDWQKEAASGNLKLAISGSKGTQTEVYMVNVKPDGSIEIPADSPAAAFFSKDANGQMQFHGAYAEVVKVNSTIDGVTHVTPLATEVGDGAVKTIPTEVTTHTTEQVPHLKLTPPAIEHVTEVPAKDIEAFGGPAIVTRRPLESLAARRNLRSGYYELGYGGYAGDINVAEQNRILEQMRRERSPSLEANPDAELNPRHEFEWYRSEVERRRGGDALRRIETQIADTPELTSMSPGTETIVTIPVGAAFESENIFNTLSLYAQQPKDRLEKSLVLLNVNWLDSIELDNEKMEKVRKTLSEIERARRRFPDLRIAVVQHTYDEAEVKRTGGVIGYVAQDLVDTALLALRKNMEDGTIPTERSVLIQRHDADMLGMGRDHIGAAQRAAEKNPETDLFRGTTRFDVRQSEKYPGWGITSDIVNMTSAWAIDNGHVRTGGANFAVRAEVLAAIGGLGDLSTGYFGSRAGSDDVAIGMRVSAARRRKPVSVSSGNRGGSYAAPFEFESSPSDRRIMKHIPGMTIDTNSERFLPIYLRGGDWNSAWTPREGSFDRGAGGYGARNQDTAPSERRERYKTLGKNDFTRLERVLSTELSYQDEASRVRVLSLFFRNVPGAYILKTESDGSLKFTFTREGKKFVQQRIERDRLRGRKSYGERKITGLYGDDSGTTSLGRRAPLVSAAG